MVSDIDVGYIDAVLDNINRNAKLLINKQNRYTAIGLQINNLVDEIKHHIQSSKTHCSGCISLCPECEWRYKND